MKVFEHFKYDGEISFVEAIAIVGSEKFVYSPSGRYSGEHQTTLTVGTAKAQGLFNPEVELGEPDPETGEPTYNIIPDETIMIFDYFLPNYQALFSTVYSRTSSDFNETKARVDLNNEFKDMPVVVDLFEYSPNGFTNQTIIFYTVEEQHEAFREWKKTLNPNQQIRYFWSQNWDFRNELVPWLIDNRQKQAEESNSSYATSPVAWTEQQT